MVIKVLTRWTDLVEAMVSVAAGAREQLVVTGSRSREKAYLAAIETAVAQHPDLVHYRVLYGPARHGARRSPAAAAGAARSVRAP
jgi:hypothetical protein